MHSYRGLISVGFLLLWYIPDSAFGYSSGAPASRCTSMLPNHPGSPQSLPGPYSIVIAKETYIPFELVDVTIEAPSLLPFAGFLLQAVQADDISINIGTFQQATGTKFVCGQHGLTHTSGTLKDSQTFQWRAPLTGLADVVFRATVVRDYFTYYVDIRSNILRNAASGTTTSSSIAPSSSVIMFSSSTTQALTTISLIDTFSTTNPTPTMTKESSREILATTVSPAVSFLTNLTTPSIDITSQTSLPPIATSGLSPKLTTNVNNLTMSSSMIFSSTSSHLTFSSHTVSKATSSAEAIEGTQTILSPTPTQTISLSSTVPGSGTNQNARGTQDGDDSSDLKVALIIASNAVWVVVVLIGAVMKCRRS